MSQQTQLELPAALSAERAVLGAVLASPAAWSDVAATLRPSDFFSDAHRVIYSAIAHMFNSGIAVDLVTLSAMLQDLHQADAAGGVSYIAALADELPDVPAAAHYARIVRAAAVRRELIRLGQETMTVAVRQETAEAALDLVSDRLAELQERRADGGLIALGAQAHEELRLMRAEAAGEAPTGLRSGFAQLDTEYLHGMRPGQLIVIGADTGVGKTSLALAMALSAGIDQGASVLYVSLEMGAAEIARRAIAIQSDISEWRLVHGRRQQRFDEEDGGDWGHAAWAASLMSQARISVVDSGHVTPGQLRGRARALKMRTGLDLVVVDYLQLMSTGSRHGNRTEEVSELSRAMKLLARDLNVPVIVLSQISRERARRAGTGGSAVAECGFSEAELPRLSDLRESGSIANDADVVLLLHRHTEGSEEQVRNALLIVAKKRSGPTGRLNLRFKPSTTRYQEGT